MALFGRKSKDTAPSTDSSATAVATAPDPGAAGDAAAVSTVTTKSSKKARSSKAPRTPKTKTVKSGTIVGLNVGNSYIKAVEVTSKNGELSVTGMGAVPTPPESISNGVVLSVNALSDAIKDLWRTAGFKSKTVITSVAGTGALVVRVIEVPRMTDGELADNMKVDADRYIPFPPSEVVMDFKALRDLPSDPDAPNMEVLLAAAQREIIDLHIKTVQNSRLDPRAIDVEPVAAVRALEVARVRETGDTYVNYNDVSALVNVGATGSEISVLRGDIVVFTRGVPTGGDAVTRAIAENLGMPLHEAEQVKIQFADALPPHGMEAAPEAQDQFGGFDDAFPDFGLGDETQPVTFEDFTTPITPADAPSAPTSDDPFDLDFFNQGPKNEPGTGHGQKEGEPPADPFDFSFSFDDAPPAPPAPPAAPAAPAAPQSTQPTSAPASQPEEDKVPLSFTEMPPVPRVEEDPALLPSHEEPGQADQTPTGTSSKAPDKVPDERVLPTRVLHYSSEPINSMPMPAAEWDDESLLPSVDDTLGRPAEAGNAGQTEAVASAPEGEVLPSLSGGWVPSAFDFSDLDLPSIDTTMPDAGVVSIPDPGPIGTPASQASFAADSSEAEPTAAPVPPAASAPIAPAATVAATDAPAAAGAAAAAGATAAAFSGFSLQGSEPEATAPTPAPAAESVAPAQPEVAEAAPAPAPAPGGFSFSFQDAPVEAPPAAPAPAPVVETPQEVETASANSFSFNEPEDVPTAPLAAQAALENASPGDETFMVTPQGEMAPPAGAAEEPAAEDDFDLDAIFGTESATDPATRAPGAVSPDETMVLGDPDGSFDLSSLGEDTSADFAALAGGGDLDTDSFGAGLMDEGGVAGVDPVLLYNCVQPVVEELVNEVRRSLEFHVSRFPDATISSITLLGGGAELMNLDVYMAQMLGVPTKVADPFANLPVNAPKLPPEYPRENGPLCTVALGLALRDFVA